MKLNKPLLEHSFSELKSVARQISLRNYYTLNEKELREKLAQELKFREEFERQGIDKSPVEKPPIPQGIEKKLGFDPVEKGLDHLDFNREIKGQTLIILKYLARDQSWREIREAPIKKRDRLIKLYQAGFTLREIRSIRPCLNLTYPADIMKELNSQLSGFKIGERVAWKEGKVIKRAYFCYPKNETESIVRLYRVEQGFFAGGGENAYEKCIINTSKLVSDPKVDAFLEK